MDDSWIPAALAEGVPPDQLELHLQPVHALAGGELVGAESFVRWQHPEHGWVPVQRWYAEAARTGALVALARAALPAWAESTRDRAGIVVSFNFSAEQLLDDDFMAEALAIPEPAARGLAVEVHHGDFLRATHGGAVCDTTTPLVADLDERLAALTARGFAVWLDDLGEVSLDEVAAGHPSVSVVKLDRSLLAADEQSVRDLVTRLHDAGKTVVIEGIETDDHRRSVLAAGVDWGQGFLYAPPLPPGRFADHCLGELRARR